MDATPYSLALPLLSVLIGCLVTLVASRKYYELAAKHLEDESAELRRLTNLVLSTMENTGQVSLTRDGAGRIVGIGIHARPTGVSVTGGVGTLIASGEQPGSPHGTPLK